MAQKPKKIEIKVQNFLRKNKGTFYKQKKIQKALNVPTAEYPALKRLLKKMAFDGKIMKGRKNSFGFPDPDKNISGIISFSTRGFAFVTMADNEEIFIGVHNSDVALHHDKVQVKLIQKTRGKRREGKVIKVLERANESVFGILKKDGNTWEVIPESPFPPTTIVLLDKNPELEEDKLVEITDVEYHSVKSYPIGKFKQIIGSPDNPADDFVIIQKMFNLGDKFPEDVMAEAEKLEFPKIDDVLKDRLDLRDKEIFTIDPITAKDFDDAVSLERIDDKTQELGVHIADVSYFVREGSALDKLALDRSMSCYLGDKVIPMLPEKLSNNLCSLKPDEPRLAFSVIMQITDEGVVREYQIQKTIIQSKKRFTYEEAQEILEKGEGVYHQELAAMNTLHKTLFKNRSKKGSVDFDLPEPIFKFDENGLPIDISPSERKDSNRLIEDFMLLANKVIATHIAVNLQKEELPFVYRVHEPPSDEKINALFETLKSLKINVPRPAGNFTPLDLQKILNHIKDTPYALFIEQISLRSMTKAMYTTEPHGHFGLAFQHYTHFTSPIRRYPDLIVHRLLKKYTKQSSVQDLEFYRKKLPRTCDYCTQMEIRYLEAEREFVKIKQIRFLSNKIDEEYEGVITGVLEFGFFVEITQFLVEGLVHVRTLDDDFYIFNQEQHTLTGRDFGRSFRLGDPVKIKVKEVSIKERRIDFLLTK